MTADQVNKALKAFFCARLVLYVCCCWYFIPKFCYDKIKSLCVGQTEFEDDYIIHEDDDDVPSDEERFAKA